MKDLPYGAVLARRAYQREWRKAHPDRVRLHQKTYWERHASGSGEAVGKSPEALYLPGIDSNERANEENALSGINMCHDAPKVNPPKRRIPRKTRTYLSTWLRGEIGVPEIANLTGQAENTVTDMFHRGIYHGVRKGKRWRTTRGQLATDLHNLKMKDLDE